MTKKHEPNTTRVSHDRDTTGCIKLHREITMTWPAKDQDMTEKWPWDDRNSTQTSWQHDRETTSRSKREQQEWLEQLDHGCRDRLIHVSCFRMLPIFSPHPQKAFGNQTPPCNLPCALIAPPVPAELLVTSTWPSTVILLLVSLVYKAPVAHDAGAAGDSEVVRFNQSLKIKRKDTAEKLKAYQAGYRSIWMCPSILF